MPAPPVAAPAPEASRAAANVRAATLAPQRPRPFAKSAVAIVILVAAALFVLRPWRPRDPSTPASTAEVATRTTPAAPPSTTTAPPAATPSTSAEPAKVAEPAPARPAASAQAEAASVPAREADKPGATATPAAPSGAAGSVTLAAAQLCRTLSTSGDWRCDPAGDSVAAGPLVLYTRVKSPRDTVVVHRWYRGDTLRRSVQLPVRASANEGYRTFSRQTVNRGADWRVEVRSAAGELLHEQHLAVR
jgi:hypothetical protein